MSDRRTKAQVSAADARGRRALQQFLYLLARDHLPVGVIEAVIDRLKPDATVRYSLDGLEIWAVDAVKRIGGGHE